MLAEALYKYGYVLLFLGAGVEGDAAMATGAFLAQQGRLDPFWTFVATVAGSCLASEVTFRLGRRHGRPWIEKRAGESPKLARVERWTAQRSGLLTFVARFLWGFRLTIPALCGASGMSQRRFSFWNAAGALFWGTVVGAGAYFFGSVLEKLYADLERNLPWIAGGLFAILFAIYLWRRHDPFAWRAVSRKVSDDEHVYRIEASPVDGVPDAEPVAEPFRGSYDFSLECDWFSHNIPTWSAMLEPFRGRPGLRYLEVGSAEGRSVLWLFENVLTHPDSRAVCIDPFYHWPGFAEKDGEVLDCFLSNLRAAGIAERVRVIHGFSQIELRKLPVDELFDVVYIDGNHRAKSVLEDLVLAWRLVRPEGLLIADDYGYKLELDPALRPRMAIDFFVETFGDELEVVHRRYQVMLRKVPASRLNNLPTP